MNKQEDFQNLALAKLLQERGVRSGFEQQGGYLGPLLGHSPDALD